MQTYLWGQVLLYYIGHCDWLSKTYLALEHWRKTLRRFCVVSFCEFCVRFTQPIVFVGWCRYLSESGYFIFLVVQQYDMPYWCKATFGLYLGFLKTTQKLLKLAWANLPVTESAGLCRAPIIISASAILAYWHFFKPPESTGSGSALRPTILSIKMQTLKWLMILFQWRICHHNMTMWYTWLMLNDKMFTHKCYTLT